MKKTDAPKRKTIKLAKETIRGLSDGSLKVVVGGAPNTSQCKTALCE